MASPIPNTRRAALQEALLAWYAASARDLPWRRRRTPYRVWLSEIMLQQTRVDQVIGYYRRFLRRFPSIRALAAAPSGDVLKVWEGLGYYTRARQLHAAAKKIAAEHGGRFPRELDAIRALPGIGPYTAAAIGSLAFGHHAAVVDGNVIRVLTRLFAIADDVGKPSARRAVQALADDLLPRGRAGAFNEALMELGATVCTPRAPRCDACPVRAHCAAFAAGTPTAYPRKAKKAPVPHKHVGAGVVIDARGRFLIAQRKETSMLGGMWEFPGGTREPGETNEECIARELKEELDIDVEVGARLITVPHAFSHFTMDLHAHRCRLRAGRPRAIHCAAWRWVTMAEFDQFPFGRADQHIIAFLRRQQKDAPRRR
ncbi:MAG TPA: A/G-specific adenine glycosylase [Kiritimatiellia bacterium]|nr:A/G-specific adenine glycosylase [Kiritimatiellia bacterium]